MYADNFYSQNFKERKIRSAYSVFTLYVNQALVRKQNFFLSTNLSPLYAFSRVGLAEASIFYGKPTFDYVFSFYSPISVTVSK